MIGGAILRSTEHWSYLGLCEHDWGAGWSLEQSRGTSGHHRAGCQLTAGRGNATESATEKRPPMGRKATGKGETAG